MHWKYPEYCTLFRMKLLQIILSQHPVDTGKRMIPKASELLANMQGHDFHSVFSASVGNALGKLGYLPWLDRASPHLGPGCSEFPHGAGPRSLLHYFPYLPGRQPTPSASCKASRLRDRSQPWLTTGVTKCTKPSPSLSLLHKNFPCK